MITTPDHSDAASSMPALEPVGPKPQGWWLDCDPATGQAGTRFRAEEFNELAANLRRFLEASGVAPVKGAPDMLLGSLNRLFAGRVTSIVATGNLTADNAGLVIVDATTADVTLTLPDASVLPAGSPAYTFVRADATTHVVRIIPLAGDVIRKGAIVLESEPAIIRSDGASTWWPLTRAGAPIKRVVTLNVAPSGVVEPADPMGGDAFNDLGSAMAWLDLRAILSPGVVTIQIAAGTYTRTTQIDIGHPNGDRLHIVGAGSATTILLFNGANGLNVRGQLIELAKLTLRGNGSAFTGLVVDNDCVIGTDVVSEQFGGGVYVSGNMTSQGGQLICRNNVTNGVLVAPAGYINFFGLTAKLSALANGGSANMIVDAGGNVRIYAYESTGAQRGLMVTNRGVAIFSLLTVIDATLPGEAVRVDNGGFLGAEFDGNVWVARNAASSVFHSFAAFDAAMISAKNCLHASCKPLTSPAINTFGNTQSYIASR